MNFSLKHLRILIALSLASAPVALAASCSGDSVEVVTPGTDEDYAKSEAFRLRVSDTSDARPITHDNMEWKSETIPRINAQVLEFKYLSGERYSSIDTLPVADAQDYLWFLSPPSSVEADPVKRFLWVKVIFTDSRKPSMFLDVSVESKIREVLTNVGKLSEFAAANLSKVALVGEVFKNREPLALLDTTKVIIPQGLKIIYFYDNVWLEEANFKERVKSLVDDTKIANLLAGFAIADPTKYYLDATEAEAKNSKIDTSAFGYSTAFEPQAISLLGDVSLKKVQKISSQLFANSVSTTNDIKWTGWNFTASEYQPDDLSATLDVSVSPEASAQKYTVKRLLFLITNEALSYDQLYSRTDWTLNPPNAFSKSLLESEQIDLAAYGSRRHLYLRFVGDYQSKYYFTNNIFDITKSSRVESIKTRVDDLDTYKAVDLTKIKISNPVSGSGTSLTQTIVVENVPQVLPLGVRVAFFWKTTQNALTLEEFKNIDPDFRDGFGSLTLEDIANLRVGLVLLDKTPTGNYVLQDPKLVKPNVDFFKSNIQNSSSLFANRAAMTDVYLSKLEYDVAASGWNKIVWKNPTYREGATTEEITRAVLTRLMSEWKFVDIFFATMKASFFDLQYRTADVIPFGEELGKFSVQLPTGIDDPVTPSGTNSPYIIIARVTPATNYSIQELPDPLTNSADKKHFYYWITGNSFIQANPIHNLPYLLDDEIKAQESYLKSISVSGHDGSLTTPGELSINVAAIPSTLVDRVIVKYRVKNDPIEPSDSLSMRNWSTFETFNSRANVYTRANNSQTSYVTALSSKAFYENLEVHFEPINSKYKISTAGDIIVKVKTSDYISPLASQRTELINELKKVAFLPNLSTSQNIVWNNYNPMLPGADGIQFLVSDSDLASTLPSLIANFKDSLLWSFGLPTAVPLITNKRYVWARPYSRSQEVRLEDYIPLFEITSTGTVFVGNAEAPNALFPHLSFATLIVPEGKK